MTAASTSPEEAQSAGPWRVVHVVYRRPLREFWILQRDTPDGVEKMLNESGRVKRFRSERTASTAAGGGQPTSEAAT